MILQVGTAELLVEALLTGEQQRLGRQEIEPAWHHLVTRSRLSLQEIETRYSRANAAQVAALLAILPYVVLHGDPVELSYPPAQAVDPTLYETVVASVLPGAPSRAAVSATGAVPIAYPSGGSSFHSKPLVVFVLRCLALLLQMSLWMLRATRTGLIFTGRHTYAAMRWAWPYVRRGSAIG